MHYGVCIFPTDYSIRIDELARAAEERGFESLFVTEHTHIPASRRTPFPGGTELPREYSHTLDPFVALTAAAAVTRTLKVGTGICLVIEHYPITLAKQVASLAFLSGGRFLFGIGGGWNAEEMENHGTAFKTRFRLLRERVLAMREIWTKDAAAFHGEFVRFDPIWSWPKPAQTPHPPILLGGESGYTLQRVVDFCDGWFPRGRAAPSPSAAPGGACGACVTSRRTRARRWSWTATTRTGRGSAGCSSRGAPPSSRAGPSARRPWTCSARSTRSIA